MSNVFKPLEAASYGLLANAMDPIFQATISWPGSDGPTKFPSGSGYAINPYIATTPNYETIEFANANLNLYYETILQGYSGSLDITSINAQALANLFADQGSVSPGFAATLPSQWGNFITVSGLIGDGFQQAISTYPPSDPFFLRMGYVPHTTTTGIGTISSTNPNVSAIVITQYGSSDVNLSSSTVVSSGTVVSPGEVITGSSTFAFAPGSAQSLTVGVSEGATISKQVTNGISNSQSNSDSGSSTFTTSGSLTINGSLFGIGTALSAGVSNAIENAWSQSSTQETNFSTSDGTQTSTLTTITLAVDINSITPNANGEYYYGDLQLIPGQTYTASISLSQASVQSGINQAFQIAGPNMSASSTFSVPSINYSSANTATLNAEQAIAFANTYGYNFISGIDNNLFQYTQGQNDYVTYSGLVTATSNGSVDGQILVQAVATPTSAYTETSPTTNLTLALGAVSAQSESTPTAKLDLALAAENLTSSANGVFFDSTQIEGDLVDLFLLGDSDLLTLDGGHQHTVHLGDLSHALSKFTNSYLTAGDGNNSIVIAPTENGNTFRLGDGNNSISVDGQGNNLFLGNGKNFIEVTGGTDTNFIIDSGAPTAILFSSENGFTQISGWDPRQDSLHFGADINLSDVAITFNYQNWSYDVYINDNLVANLLSVGGLSLSDPTTGITSQSYSAPISIALQTTEGFLTGLYADAFSRAPDLAGFNYWSNALLDGTTRIQATQYFFTSAEFEANFASSSQYVEALYHQLLGRTSDQPGLEYWTAEIDGGASHAAVVYAMLNNAEFINLVGVNYPA
jgi:hypothetical protein